MADQTTYITILTDKLASAFSLIFNTGMPVGYYPLSNAQFDLFVRIGSKKFQLGDPPPLVGVSDFSTSVNPGDTVYWEITTDADLTILPPNPARIQNLSIDLISIYDAANAPTIFNLPIMPVRGEGNVKPNTKWMASVRGDYENDGTNFPRQLGYKIQFSFVYDNNYYYFQFDPVILPKPKPTTV